MTKGSMSMINDYYCCSFPNDVSRNELDFSAVIFYCPSGKHASVGRVAHFLQAHQHRLGDPFPRFYIFNHSYRLFTIYMLSAYTLCLSLILQTILTITLPKRPLNFTKFASVLFLLQLELLPCNLPGSAAGPAGLPARSPQEVPSPDG